MKDERSDKPTPPGLIHAYQAYDPKAFPSPLGTPPDLAGAAMEHVLAYGSARELTPEELARAVRIDPSMFPNLGPSIGALLAMLEERKRKILATHEVESVQGLAAEKVREAARRATGEGAPPKGQAGDFYRAVKEEQIAELERLWYAQKDERGAFARAILGVMGALGEKYQVEELAAKREFSGREGLTVEGAIAVKEELDAIDRLLDQLREAEKTAQVGIIDLEELSEFAESAQIEELNALQKQVEEYLKAEAERQGVEQGRAGLALSPRAYRLFQSRVLAEIFGELEAARSGRHGSAVEGEGPVEMARTRGLEFGDSPAHLDVVATLLNRAARDPRGPVRGDDLVVHATRNNPRCATVVLLDMSGSMRHGGQYVNVKRMGLALDGLIRSEFPGDFLRFVEVATFARVVTAAELVTLLPKPVSIHSPVVRLRADMGDPEVLESRVPQHFTNIQHGLATARRLLAGAGGAGGGTPNKRVVVITDGLPTAHFEERHLYMLYPPDPRTEEATMREAQGCAREGITINLFLLPSWSQTHEDVRFAQRLAESARGRVFFTGGKDLDRYVLWDYVAMRRGVIG
jgi:uncharacterized protein with von Willebrand factor type A (vWA) domain